MRDMLSAAATMLNVAAADSGETWGWQGRTLSGPVTSATGNAWLRLVEAPESKAGGKLWEGPLEAERTMPSAVPRPRLRERRTWTDGGYGYLAELYDRVDAPVIAPYGPVLREAPDLGSGWWEELGAAVGSITAVSTDRVAVRQQYLDRAMPQFLGFPVDTRVPAWSTAHGDLHWANLTAPKLTILDWEGWGIAPAGYDVALLYSYSLLVPATAAEIRQRFSHLLDSRCGHFAQLVVITELLQSNTRGDNLELEAPLRKQLEGLRSVSRAVA
ncbi:hypothetical protein ACFY2K_08010 [Kitasatospora sp. NPDC001309]|uniref:hypothetical protein n=1 Tax=Kitasatospora sp. NPDC001309 TaxID=3364013 RepID=UPI003690E2CE